MSGLTERQFGALLKRAARHASRGKEIAAAVTEAFNERYGCTHSDVDCDDLIDALDYGAEAPTVAEADAAMEACGAPRIAGRAALAAHATTAARQED